MNTFTPPLVPQLGKSQNQPIFDETITDVSQSAHKYFFKQYKKQIFILFLATVLWILLMVWVRPSGGVLVIVVMMPLVFWAALYSSATSQVQNIFYKQFAQANSLTYDQNGTVGGLTGAIFSIGHGTGMHNVVTGTYKNFPIALFNYDYTIDSGKNQETYLFTVFKVDFLSPVPDILLLIDKQKFGQNLVKELARGEKVPLEGIRNNSTLYTEQGLEIEALQIFTPDVLEQLQTAYSDFSLNFSGTSLFIYNSYYIGTKQKLTSLYQLAEYVIDHLAPTILRMQGDVLAMQAMKTNQL